MVCLRLQSPSDLMVEYAQIPALREHPHADIERAVRGFSFLLSLRVHDRNRLSRQGRDVLYPPRWPGLAHHFAAL